MAFCMKHFPKGKLLSAAVALTLFTASCAHYTPEMRHETDLPLPEAYTLYGPMEPGTDTWWQDFQSEELNRLVEEALADNLTIAQAVARIRQAGALVQQAHALRQPSLSYGGDVSLSRQRTEVGGGESSLDATTRRLNAINGLLGAATGGTGTLLSAVNQVQQGRDSITSLRQSSPDTTLTVDTDNYGLGLTVGYEVDLWGRLQAGEEAALADWEASREDVHAALLSVVGQVAITWLDRIQVSRVLEVVRGQAATNKTNLGLIELRYRNGLATALDVYQQRQAVAETEAALPLLEAQEALLQHTLAVLLGKAPKTDLNLTTSEFTSIIPLPEPGLPSDLLARRPDVRAAGLRLRSADWEVSAAQADRLPQLQLTAGLSTDVASLGALFDNWLAQLAASVTGPLFDGGRREAEVERARAVVDERLAAYRLTVLGAVTEVEDALILIDRQQAFIAALDTQLEAAQNAHREALGRYRQGLTDYLPVLTALRNLQGLERDVVEAAHDLRVYHVQLRLALGGTWMAEELNDLKEMEL